MIEIWFPLRNPVWPESLSNGRAKYVNVWPLVVPGIGSPLNATVRSVLAVRDAAAN